MIALFVAFKMKRDAIFREVEQEASHLKQQ